MINKSITNVKLVVIYCFTRNFIYNKRFIVKTCVNVLSTGKWKQKMDDKTIDRIFAGSLNDLPPVSSKIVRIFTSSTFTDMLMERNTLMEYVYPKIKEYCREKHGLEFQVNLSWDKSTLHVFNRYIELRFVIDSRTIPPISFRL